MKKIIAFLLVLCMAFALAGCNSFDKDHKYFDAKGFIKSHNSFSSMKDTLEEEGFEVDMYSDDTVMFSAQFFSLKTDEEYEFNDVLYAEYKSDTKHVFLEVYDVKSGAAAALAIFGKEWHAESHEYSFGAADSPFVIIGYVDLYEDNGNNTEDKETSSYEDTLGYH